MVEDIREIPKSINCDSIDRIPEGEHWAIVENIAGAIATGSHSAVKGHMFTKYTAYWKRGDWEADVKKLVTSGKAFKALHVLPSKVVISIHDNVALTR